MMMQQHVYQELVHRQDRHVAQTDVVNGTWTLAMPNIMCQRPAHELGYPPSETLETGLVHPSGEGACRVQRKMAP